MMPTPKPSPAAAQVLGNAMAEALAHVERLEQRTRELEAERDEACKQLALIAERAVVDWDDRTVGECDAATEGETYGDWVRDVVKRVIRCSEAEAEVARLRDVLHKWGPKIALIENAETERDKARSALRTAEAEVQRLRDFVRGVVRCHDAVDKAERLEWIAARARELLFDKPQDPPAPEED